MQLGMKDRRPRHGLMERPLTIRIEAEQAIEVKDKIAGNQACKGVHGWGGGLTGGIGC